MKMWLGVTLVVLVTIAAWTLLLWNLSAWSKVDGFFTVHFYFLIAILVGDLFALYLIDRGVRNV